MKQKTKKKAQNSQVLLLWAIVNYLGGNRKAAKYLQVRTEEDIDEHNIANWKTRGKVPLQSVLLVADALKVSPYALNYSEYSTMIRKTVAWKDVVNEVKFLDKATKNKVLSGAHP